MRILSSCLLVANVVFCFGCANEPASVSTPKTNNTSTKTDQSKKTTVNEELKFEIGPAGNPLPPLDGGKIKAVGPADWKFLPRNSEEYIIGFYLQEKSGIPRILLKGSDAAEIKPLTDQDSVAAFLTQIQTELADIDFMHKPAAVQIGENYWIRYVRAGRFNSQGANRLILETVQGNRRYLIELQVLDGELQDHGSAVYRLAQDMKFKVASEEPMAVENPAVEEESTNEEASESEEEI